MGDGLIGSLASGSVRESTRGVRRKACLSLPVLVALFFWPLHQQVPLLKGIHCAISPP